MFFGSNQNSFEKNLSGKITITETVLDNGMTERNTVGEVSGIPVPFTNPQTNLVVEDNNGKIKKNGEPSMFSPPKVLATEMLAIIKTEFNVKYGLNIDFSIEPPAEITPEPTIGTTDTTDGTTGATESSSKFGFNFDKDKALIAAALVGNAALIGVSAFKMIKNSKENNKAKEEGTKAAGTVGKAVTDAKGNTTGSVGTSGTIGAVIAPTKIDTAPIEDNKIKGIRILVPSQYIDVYEISKYGGVPALMTNKDSKQMVWLDKDYDRPEFLPSNLTSPQKVNDDGTGDFKIGIHLGYPGGKKVGNWSEDGSQVFSTADELNDFFKLCDTHKEKNGNKFTYTLATREDWDEAQKSVQTNKAVPDPGTAPEPPPAVAEKGTSGTSGTPVNSGTSGTSGTPVNSGTSGTSGTPVNSGTSGTSGTDLTPSEPKRTNRNKLERNGFLHTPGENISDKTLLDSNITVSAKTKGSAQLLLLDKLKNMKVDSRNGAGSIFYNESGTDIIAKWIIYKK